MNLYDDISSYSSDCPHLQNRNMRMSWGIHMFRVLFLIVIPLILPAVTYLIWRTFMPPKFGGSEAAANAEWEPLPWTWLLICGGVLMLISLTTFIVFPDIFVGIWKSDMSKRIKYLCAGMILWTVFIHIGGELFELPTNDPEALVLGWFAVLVAVWAFVKGDWINR